LRTARGTGPPDTVSHPRPLLLLLTKSGINSVCSPSHLHAHRDRNGWSPDQVQYIQSDAPYRNYTTRFHPSNCILSALAMPIMEDRGIGLRPPVRHRLTGWEHCAERSSVLCRREHEGWTHTAFCVASASGSAVNINSTQGGLVRIAAGGWHRSYCSLA
jgi:hypothetical protein